MKLQFKKGIETIVNQFIEENRRFWWENATSLKRILKTRYPLLGSLEEEEDFTYIFVGPTPSVSRYEIKIPKEFEWRLKRNGQYHKKENYLSKNKLQAHIGLNYSILLEYGSVIGHTLLLGKNKLSGVGSYVHHFGINHLEKDELFYCRNPKKLNHKFFENAECRFLANNLEFYKNIIITSQNSQEINMKDYLLVSVESEEVYQKVAKQLKK